MAASFCASRICSAVIFPAPVRPSALDTEAADRSGLSLPVRAAEADAPLWPVLPAEEDEDEDEEPVPAEAVFIPRDSGVFPP